MPGPPRDRVLAAMNGACPVWHSRDVWQAFVKHEIPQVKGEAAGHPAVLPP